MSLYRINLMSGGDKKPATQSASAVASSPADEGGDASGQAAQCQKCQVCQKCQECQECQECQLETFKTTLEKYQLGQKSSTDIGNQAISAATELLSNNCMGWVEENDSADLDTYCTNLMSYEKCDTQFPSIASDAKAEQKTIDDQNCDTKVSNAKAEQKTIDDQNCAAATSYDVQFLSGDWKACSSNDSQIKCYESNIDYSQRENPNKTEVRMALECQFAGGLYGSKGDGTQTKTDADGNEVAINSSGYCLFPDPQIQPRPSFTDAASRVDATMYGCVAQQDMIDRFIKKDPNNEKQQFESAQNWCRQGTCNMNNDGCNLDPLKNPINIAQNCNASYNGTRCVWKPAKNFLWENQEASKEDQTDDSQ